MILIITIFFFNFYNNIFYVYVDLFITNATPKITRIKVIVVQCNRR
jgi:hypothetical protein